MRSGTFSDEPPKTRAKKAHASPHGVHPRGRGGGLRPGPARPAGPALARDHPARGRQGGADGAPTTIVRSDGEKMRGKGRQFVPHGKRVLMAFPGGAGFGDRTQRDKTLVKRDLARGYISAESATNDYGLSADDVASVLAAVRNGEAL